MIMLIGTHALSPMVFVATVQVVRKLSLNWRELMLIGFVGAVPDLLNPHIYLASRHTSWSHSLVGFAAVMVFPLVIGSFSRKLRWPVVGLMALAYLWHLFCDFVAGGIPYLYPLKEGVVGGYYIPLWSWILFDAFFVVAVVVLFSINRVRVKS